MRKNVFLAKNVFCQKAARKDVICVHQGCILPLSLGLTYFCEEEKLLPWAFGMNTMYTLLGDYRNLGSIRICIHFPKCICTYTFTLSQIHFPKCICIHFPKCNIIIVLQNSLVSY